MAPEMLRKVLRVLTGDPSPRSVQHGGALLYLFSNRVEFVRQMPRFDEWGLRPAGLEGPRENPVFVAPLPTASMALAPEAGAGGAIVVARRQLDCEGAGVARGSQTAITWGSGGPS